MLIEELRKESASVELELKEISAGFSSLNKKLKYERLNRFWVKAWDRLDEDNIYYRQIINMAYHMMPAVEDDSCSEDVNEEFTEYTCIVNSSWH